MKTTRRILIFCLMSIIFCNIHAQKNSSSVPELTFDCAKPDNSISATDLINCKKLVLSGSGNYGNYKVIAAIVSMNIEGNVKEFKLNDNIFSEELTIMISKLKTGSKINVENIKIQNTKDIKIIKNLPPASLTVK